MKIHSRYIWSYVRPSKTLLTYQRPNHTQSNRTAKHHLNRRPHGVTTPNFYLNSPSRRFLYTHLL